MYILNGFLLLVAQVNDEQSMYLPLGKKKNNNVYFLPLVRNKQ